MRVRDDIVPGRLVLTLPSLNLELIESIGSGLKAAVIDARKLGSNGIVIQITLDDREVKVETLIGLPPDEERKP